ncbi:MAG: LCP family protein [Actinomycetota bacterium]|nr:LCP family protein [Actinomycetota bacterium]
MPDRPGGKDDEPEYNWLYGAQGRPVSGPPEPPPSDDPEPTRMLPTMSRPEASGDGPGGPRRRSTATAAPPPRLPVAPPKRPGGRRPWRRILLVVLLVWLVFLIAVPVWAWQRIGKVDASPSGQRPADQPGTTYLLVGSDSRANLSASERKKLGTGNAAGQRTDTIMLLHTGSGPNLLLSIPRDSPVNVPGYGVTKINAAFAYGGPKLLVKTIEQNTGVRVDHYVEIGFGGFVNSVDAVGGIDVCTQKQLDDPLANLHMRKGCHHVDGITALAYARTRHTQQLGDVDRARNQRKVVSQVGAKVKSPWTVINPMRYFRVADAGSGSLRISNGTGPFALARFAWAMTRVNGSNGLTCSMPIVGLSTQWDRPRALALLKLVKQDRTSDISKNLCTPSGLPTH